MLLGCCHCEGDVSSSSGSSSSGSTISSINSCANCVVAPKKFSMQYTTPTGTSFYPCCSTYKSVHILKHSSSCVWKTDETGMHVDNGPGGGSPFQCLTSTNSNVKPRFELSITGSLTYTIVMINYRGSGGVRNDLRVRTLFQKTVTSSDCFATVRVPFVSIASFSSDSIPVPPGGFNTGGQLNICSSITQTASNSYIDITPI